MALLRSSIAFLRETRRDFFHTGAIMPSSRSLARALAAPLAGERAPARILEVGPGTGAVTSIIVEHLRPGDQLDIVEINEHFIEHLRRLVETEERFQPHRQQIRLVHGPVEEVNGELKYDFIISGLPLNNFPAAMVRRLFRVFRRLVTPGGTLSFFEYAGIRRLKMPFVGVRERRRLSSVGHVVAAYVKKHQVQRHLVIANMPPAFARHLRF